MKRNWLPYVAITAALVAGTICSSAFAGNPGGFKIGSGGGNSRSFGGLQSSGQNNGQNVTRARVGTLNGQNLGQSLGGMQTQIKKFNGNGNGNFGGNFGQAIGGGSNNATLPKIKINPGVINGNFGQANGGGLGRVTTPKIGINPNVINQIKQGNLNGIGNGNGSPKLGKIDPGFNKGNIGQAIGQAIINHGNGGGNGHGFGQQACHKDIHCGPIKVGCKPWWTECYSHCHNHCYKPSYPVCSQTIIVQVPVVTEVITVQQPAMQIPVGSTLTLQALGLGDAAGQVMLQVDKIAIPAMVNEWRPDAVTTTLPMLGLASPVRAEIVMVRADGTVANSILVELVNALPVAAEAQAQVGQGQVVPAQAIEPDQGGAAAALGGL